MFRIRSLFLCQIVAAMVAFAIFDLWPPAAGRMLLVPLDGSDRNAVAGVALAGGAVLLRAGTLPGSMVVAGNRADMRVRLRGRTILFLAASGATCGGGVRGA